eukprot:CAMPEP_0182444564 /NCGR_PEP_ID=MMETSP1172-20130603/2978_1 /TAXON_ID=708627 /ORGANISM="Timspurckia oligopyrenoides, Strain CCMP3278" /LENGTH=221 /DNA_ID=CAMNT_0024640151 /DNA_START=925 /DNA_END=1587 /DNA_ORIENTATION=-
MNSAGMLENLFLSGLRNDGRKPDEFRNLRAQFHPVDEPDGSCLLTNGYTQVLATIHGPRDSISSSSSSSSNLTVSYSIASFSSLDRIKQSHDKRAFENASKLKSIFESILDSESRQNKMHIGVHVLQADGSVFTTAVNAITLALIDASVSCLDTLIGTTIGIVSDEKLLCDLNGMESGVNGELIVVFAPNLNKLVAVEFDGMRLNSVEILENAIEFGKNTC